MKSIGKKPEHHEMVGDVGVSLGTDINALRAQPALFARVAFVGAF